MRNRIINIENLASLSIILLLSFLLFASACKKTHVSNFICDCADSKISCKIGIYTLNIPNLITPNGDGKNDVWRIVGLEHFPNSKVKITGPGNFIGTVYESSDYLCDWNGEKNGKALREGKYKYEITIDGQTFSGLICIYYGHYKSENKDCLMSINVYDRDDPMLWY